MSSLFLLRRLRIHLETEVLPQQTLPCYDVRAFFPGRQAALLVEVVDLPPIFLVSCPNKSLAIGPAPHSRSSARSLIYPHFQGATLSHIR